MVQTLLTILGISVMIALPASMISLSLKSGSLYLKELFGNPRLLIKYFLVMFILMPALAFLFYMLDPSHQVVWIAVIVISISPASPGMVKGITKLGGNAGLSTAWLIIAILISFIMIPVNLTILEKILNVDVNIGLGEIITKLMSMFIIPLLLGFLLAKLMPGKVSILAKILDGIFKIAGLVLVICLLIIAVPMIIQNGLVEFCLVLLFLIVALAITHFIESSDKKHGPILTYSVISRLPAPALAIAAINDSTKIYAPVILTFVICGLILMKVYNKLFYPNQKEE